MKLKNKQIDYYKHFMIGMAIGLITYLFIWAIGETTFKITWVYCVLLGGILDTLYVFIAYEMQYKVKK